MSNSLSEQAVTLVRCQRCDKQLPREKAARVSLKNREMTFCENCFKAVFKYDESLRTVSQIYDQNGRKTPFTIRSNNWHKSSFMVVNEVKTTSGKNGSSKIVFVGDFFLRGVLKEQGHSVGKANHFIWTPWSADEAAKYKEDTGPNESSARSEDASEM